MWDMFFLRCHHILHPAILIIAIILQIINGKYRYLFSFIEDYLLSRKDDIAHSPVVESSL